MIVSGATQFFDFADGSIIVTYADDPAAGTLVDSLNNNPAPVTT